MTFSEKLETLLTNYEWTKKQLAEYLGYDPSSITKWKKCGIIPPYEILEKICDIFSVPLVDMIDGSVDIPEFIEIDRYLPYFQLNMPECKRDSEHVIIDAALAKGARLHRFTNHGGYLCSAIYCARQEVWWHYREYEPRMIRDWNKEYGND